MAKKDIMITDVDAGTNKVNSGNVIELAAVSLRYQVGTFVQTTQEPAKPINQTHTNLLPYGDFVGFSSPTITISGVINLQDYTSDSDGGTPPTTTVTQIDLKLLQQMYKTGHVFKLEDYYDYTNGTDFIYRFHTLSGIFPAETKTYVNVMCTGVDIKNSTAIEEGALMDYTITFKEVRT